MWVCRRRYDELLERFDHLHLDVIELNRLIRIDLGVDMTTNDELKDVDANLTEGLTELSGLPAEIAELVAQAGDAADPALVESILAKSKAIADIVPNAPAPDPTPVPDPEPTPDPAPVDVEPAEPVADA